MHGRGKSDSSIVPGKAPNKAEGPAAEVLEGRGLAKGNRLEQNAPRTQGRKGRGAPSALERIREAAQKDRKQQFTALLHHVYEPERLSAAFRQLRHDAAAGVDGRRGVPNFEKALGLVPDLEALGYEFRPDEEIPDRHYFRRRRCTARTHHLSLAEPTSQHHRVTLAFRDALRANPAVAESYAQLKLQLAEWFPHDRSRYLDGKSAFIEAVLAREGKVAVIRRSAPHLSALSRLML